MTIDANQSLTPIAESLRQEPFSFRSRVVAAAAAYAVAGGAVTLLGWILDSPRLTDWANIGISMFPNTALCASLTGVALLLLTRHRAGERSRTAPRILGIIVAVIGGLTLFEHVSGKNLGIDTLLFDRPWGQRAAAAPMRMGPPASTSFLILGAGLLLATGGQRARWLASTLAILPVAISSLSIIGYWFGSDHLYTIVHLTGIAIQTSSILAMLGIGLMGAVPEHGMVSLLCRDDAGGMLVRRLLLPIIIVPLFLGWLRLLGEEAGLFDRGFGVSVLLLTTIAMLLGLLAWTALGLSRAAQATKDSRDQLEAFLKKDISDRIRAEQALREREQRYELVLVGTEAAIWDWDVAQKRVIYSPRWKQLRGLSDSEAGDSEEEWSKRIHPEDHDRVMAAVHAHFDGRTSVFSEEYRVLHKDGRWIWILDRGIARRDESGQVVRMAGSETDITERKQLEDQLQQQVKELAEADQRKNEFLATLAHELRNPLAPICNSLQLLRMTRVEDLSSSGLQEIMERQVDHMVRLVDDLMEMSRINNGKIDLRPERIEIAGVLRSAVETSKPLIEANRHQLMMNVPPEPLTVVGDAVRLSQVVANLLNNAAKYTEPGGRIWLAASRENGHVSVSVRDTGVGISCDLMPGLFQMFSQAEKDHKRAQGGLGIGLALAKSLVELHGGRIEAHSEGDGCGSEFVMRLPLADGQWPVVDGSAVDCCENHLMAGSRVLVVDDNQDAARTLAMLLRALGNDVRTADNGPAALETIQSFKPTVVLLDLGMPGMSGYEVAVRARATPAGRECVLVALTGWGQEADRRRSREAGFDYHLLKPVEIEELKVLLSENQVPSRAPGRSAVVPQ